MKYEKIYNDLILRAKNRILKEYTEKHHIIPKCISGLNNKENIIELTGREHYIAHQLLVKIHPNNRSILHAACMMTVSNKHDRSKNRLYEWLRIKLSNSAKKRVGEKNGSFGKPWYHNPKTLKSGKFIPGTEPFGWQEGRTRNTKCQVCNQNTGSKKRKFCDNHKYKSLSPTERGYIFTKKDRKKLSNYCKLRTKEQHPQFGKRWINNGYLNKMVAKEQLSLHCEKGWNIGKIKKAD